MSERPQSERIAVLLAEMDAESGPLPGEVLAAARRVWRRDQPGDSSADKRITPLREGDAHR